jgi:uncharacterized protein with HEPN domain
LKDQDRDWFHLRQMLRFIAHIERRLAGLSEAEFHADRDEIDLTAYRFQMIGEAARKLSDTLKARHPDIKWPGIVGMRNVIAHDYEGLASTVMWNAARDELGALARVCRDELAALGGSEPDI